MTKNNLYEHQKRSIVSAYFILGTLEFSNVDISIWVSILSPYSVIVREMTPVCNIRMASGGIVECILLFVWIDLFGAPCVLIDGLYCTYRNHNKHTPA